MDTNPYSGTIMTLQEAAVELKRAADLLVARDSFHLQHARGNIQEARIKLDRAERQIDRAQQEQITA